MAYELKLPGHSESGADFVSGVRGKILPAGAADYLRRRIYELTGCLFITAAILLFAAIVSYAPDDPSLNSASFGDPENLLGLPGAIIADLLGQGFGLAGLLPPLVFAVWGWRLVHKHRIPHPWARGLLLFLAMGFAAIGLSVVPVIPTWPLSIPMGGVSGLLLLDQALILLSLIIPTATSLSVGTGAGVLAITALCAACEFRWRDWRTVAMTIGRTASFVGHGAKRTREAFGVVPAWRGWSNSGEAEPEPEMETFSDVDVHVSIGKNDSCDNVPVRTGLVESKKARAKIGRKAKAARQGSLDLVPNDDYVPPPLELLEAATGNSTDNIVNKDALQQNAQFLGSVLEDFGVKGEIVKVRPGPVVTLYELEPAPGTKTSRVIGLSDDIARSMSAVSVRVSVVPGRNVIGIELPNVTREMVHLREILGSADFEKTGGKGKLPLALGKDISGASVTVDLARMPHLLIAGTTGSGKSVAMNTMILSLLYHCSPAQCRGIMIDPKMLELSVYEGIPHLLTPVVTDPSKAVVALKWTVREMEDRYRNMSQLGVRNIAGYNARLAEANKKGKVLTRRVQTGFDDDGKPVIEEQPLSMTPLPFIVVVVDEMADLMLVAGKDVEAAIQRLAQMARAAGIHLIMATQRPSVDVITGTIKANFPTRISFQVTSKIDSRTILGEQGAEQLLGQGDMLYMEGGGRITRVHGPFVSDEEVEQIVDHLKGMGEPDYMDEITAEDEPALPGASGGDDGDVLYDEAVALIAREGKASTSFIQRHLQIGYNRAARIIERMESQGVVSPANRVGRREVLIGSH